MTIKPMIRFACLAAAISCALTARSAHALTINATFSSDVTTEMKTGFQQAANYWSSVLTDNITVNVNVGTATLSGNTLAQASYSYYSIPYTNFKSALTSDSKTATDYSAVSYLQTGSSVFFSTNSISNSTFYTTSSNSIYTTPALTKALGFQVPALDSDGTITYNKDTFASDFDRSNGIDFDKYDFVGVTIHEIGHLLGFSSGADDSSPMLTALDLFRYGSAGELQVGVGGSPYFSIDGGTTSLGTFSTGITNGDGNQASHWKELNPSLGIMDPMVANGELMAVSPLDLIAFDAMGYDLTATPEPATLGMLALAVPLMLRQKK